MSNHKMQFPSHISKSWLSVCIFIFLLTVCVGLAIHVTSEEDAICSDSDHSEVPIVSNENVSEKSGSDIEYAKNYVPTEEDVLAARQQATEGMSQQQIENLTEVVKTANLWLEHKYMNGDFLSNCQIPIICTGITSIRPERFKLAGQLTVVSIWMLYVNEKSFP